MGPTPTHYQSIIWGILRALYNDFVHVTQLFLSAGSTQHMLYVDLKRPHLISKDSIISKGRSLNHQPFQQSERFRPDTTTIDNDCAFDVHAALSFRVQSMTDHGYPGSGSRAGPGPQRLQSRLVFIRGVCNPAGVRGVLQPSKPINFSKKDASNCTIP